MIASKLALSLILVAANVGTNKFAVGLDDAPQFDQGKQQPASTLFVPEAPADAGADTVGEQTGRNGFDVVDNNASAEIRSNDAGGTVPTTKMERSLRLAGAPAGVSRWQV